MYLDSHQKSETPGQELLVHQVVVKKTEASKKRANKEKAEKDPREKRTPLKKKMKMNSTSLVRITRKIKQQ